jgi:outer membrane biosynthesis protein TonB
MIEMMKIAMLCALSVATILPQRVPAQQKREEEDPPCISPNERIYRPGEGGVKPPSLHKDHRANDDADATEIQGQFSVELLVSASGRVCSVRVLRASDASGQQAVLKVGAWMTKNWTFSPAVRKGMPVAVRFILNWSAKQ